MRDQNQQKDKGGTEPKRITLQDFEIETLPQEVLEILKQLRNAKHDALLVGGCVRDYLLGVEPKDFDMVTEAHPERVKKVISRSRIIGRRFKLVHAYRKGHLYEIATYRKQPRPKQKPLNQRQRIQAENSYGTQSQDAYRRDFTVNALFFNPSNKQLIDYTGGLEDIENRVLRSIGDPLVRFIEDPVRILRAIRLSAKLKLEMDPQVVKAIRTRKRRLHEVKHARLRDELAKLLLNGQGQLGFQMMREFDIHRLILPSLEQDKEFIEYAMIASDQRIQSLEPLSMGYLYAVLLWSSFQSKLDELSPQGHKYRYEPEWHKYVLNQVISETSLMRGLPNHIRVFVAELFFLQDSLESRNSIKQTLANKCVRAAIHLFALRSQVGEVDSQDVEWWKKRQPNRRARSTQRVNKQRVS